MKTIKADYWIQRLDDLTVINDVINYGLQRLENARHENIMFDDVAYYLFAGGGFIQDRIRSEKWLLKAFGSVFTAIDFVREFEEDDPQTELTNPEKLTDRVVDIIGERLLYQCEEFWKSSDKVWASESHLRLLTRELKSLWVS